MRRTDCNQDRPLLSVLASLGGGSPVCDVLDSPWAATARTEIPSPLVGK